MFVGPRIAPWGSNIMAKLEGDPHHITERLAISYLIERVTHGSRLFNTQQEATQYTDSWIKRWDADENLPDLARRLLGRYLFLRERETSYFGNDPIGLQGMMCTLVIALRNVGKSNTIGILKDLNKTEGHLTHITHGFRCRVAQGLTCAHPHHVVWYELQPQLPNIPSEGVAIRAGDPGYNARFLLRLSLRPVYKQPHNEHAAQDVLAWADFFDFAKHGMRGRCKVSYRAQHGRWRGTEQTERDSSTFVSVRTQQLSNYVETNLARDLASQWQSLYQYQSTKMMGEES